MATRDTIDTWKSGRCATVAMAMLAFVAMWMTSGCGDPDLQCGATSVACAGSCVDTQVNPRHCGACGIECGAGETCMAGQCVLACPAGTTECDGTCVYTDIDPDHCGGCGQACDMFPQAYAACVDSMCFQTGCEAGFEDCNGDLELDGCEADLDNSNLNCGACGQTCLFTESCAQGGCAEDPELVAQYGLQILSMDASAAVCTAVDHLGITGDDRGALAVGQGRFYYVGDGSGARFDLPNMDQATAVTPQDGLFSDLETGTVYSLTIAGAPSGPPDCDAIFDGFIALNPDTLDPMGTATLFSTPIPNSCDGASKAGVFSGRGFAMVHTEARQTYAFTVADGQVHALGQTLDLNDAQNCESWALWGVAEYFGGELYAVYRSPFVPPAIVRQSVRTGEVTTILDLSGLNVSNLCSIGLDLNNGLWAWQYQGTGSLDMALFAQSAGVCPASFETP